MRRFILIIALTIVGSVSGEDTKPRELKITEVSKKEDSATVETNSGKTLIVVRASARSSGCTLSAPKGAWPERVELFLESYKALEHFEMTIGRMYVSGSEKSSGSMSAYFLGEDLDFKKRSNIGTIDIRVERQKNGFLVRFPDKLFGDTDKVTLGWVSWLDK